MLWRTHSISNHHADKSNKRPPSETEENENKLGEKKKEGAKDSRRLGVPH